MRSFLLSAAALLSAAGVSVAAPLVGVAGYGPFGNQGLYSFDLDTGQATLIGLTGLSEINGLAWDASGGTLYATTSGSDLYRINPFTGASTLVADAFGISPEGGLTFDGQGNLWAVRQGELGTVDLSNGQFSGVSFVQSPATDFSGLGFDAASGNVLLYAKNGSDSDRAMVVDPLTGGVQQSVAYDFAGAGSVGGLDVDPMTDAAVLSDGSSLFVSLPGTIDFDVTGGLSTGVTGISGLAFIPSPGSLALLAFGGVVASRRRRG